MGGHYHHGPTLRGERIEGRVVTPCMYIYMQITMYDEWMYILTSDGELY